MTPDRVETRIGTLEFDDGFPTAGDRRPALRPPRLPAGRRGVPQRRAGGVAGGDAHRDGGARRRRPATRSAIVDDLLDSNPLFLTGNTDTVYVSGILDLERDGPTVVEIPPGCGPTTVNDAWFRFITDMGRPGPDRGRGRQVPDRARRLRRARSPTATSSSESPSRINWLILRGLLVDGKPDAPTKNFHEGLRVYPLSQVDDPPAMEFISMSGKEFNTIHANDVAFFDELDAVIQREPLDVIDPEIRGLLASIGIKKGTPFAPDERMRALLTEAAEVANGTARAIAFKTRDPEAYKYPGPRVEDRVHRQRLPLAHRRRRRRPQPRRPDAVLLHRHREHAGHGAAHPRRRLAVRLHRARQHRRVPRRRPSATSSPSRPTSRPRTSGRSSPTTRRPDPSSRPASRIPSQNNTRDPLAANDDGSITLTFGPDRARRRTPRTGSRPSPARSGSPSSGSTARSSPGSTRPGSPATSSPPDAERAGDRCGRRFDRRRPAPVRRSRGRSPRGSASG